MILKKFNYLILLLTLNCVMLSQESEEQEYDFILLVNHDYQYFMAKFPLKNLKKCHFPQGPLRANMPVNEDFKKIDGIMYNKVKQNSIELNLFCIEDGIMRCKRLNNEEITLKKCAFDVPQEPKLHYVFCVKEDIKNISGHIILRSKIENFHTNLNSEPSFEELIDDPDLELKAKLKIEDEKVGLNTKISNYAKLLFAIINIQYLKIKDYFTGTYRNQFKKDELSKFKPNFDEPNF